MELGDERRRELSERSPTGGRRAFALLAVFRLRRQADHRRRDAPAEIGLEPRRHPLARMPCEERDADEEKEAETRQRRAAPKHDARPADAAINAAAQLGAILLQQGQSRAIEQGQALVALGAAQADLRRGSRFLDEANLLEPPFRPRRTVFVEDGEAGLIELRRG